MSDDYPGKPGPKTGAMRELRTDILRLYHQLDALKARVAAVEPTLMVVQRFSRPGPTIEGLAEKIFVARAANLKIEGFPPEAIADAKAQEPVNQFWLQLRDHSLLAAAAFFREADPLPAEAPEPADTIKPNSDSAS